MFQAASCRRSEGSSVRALSCVMILVVLTSMAGCSLFKKNNADGSGGSAGAGGTPPAKFPSGQDPLLNSSRGTPPKFPPAAANVPAPTAMLAGSVHDAWHRPVANSYVRLVNLDEKDNGPPIDVSSDGSGYFIISGLKPGIKYQLIARAKQ